MTEHLGYDKHAVEGRNNDNSRNGTRAKTVTTPAARRGDHRGPAGPLARTTSRRNEAFTDASDHW